MVQLQSYLRNTNDFQNSKHLPMLNSLFIQRFSELNPYSADNNFKTFMIWARKSPQLMGFLNILATDIISDKVEFEPITKSSSGTTNVARAQAFWDQNNGMEVIEEMLYDFFINGIGYNWIGVVSDSQLKEFCDIAIREVSPELKSVDREFKAERLFGVLKQNNQSDIPKKWRHVAASTMTIYTDEYDVQKYVQRVGVNIQRFVPDEMIVFKLMPLDGKIYPFPPMECLLAEVYLLWLITQNYVSFFENGGKPDNVFILPKEIAGSKNHEYLIDTLRKYKKIQNKHGNLVFTGELSIEKLMEVEHQMENKDLGLYLVSILAMMYGVPIGRLPFLVGKAAVGGDSGGLADSGYWRKISVWQSKVETPLNNRIWSKFFGVKMKFGRGYLQDEVRETQNDVQKNSVAEQRLSLGLWTVQAAGKYLKIDEDIIEEAQAEKKKRDEELKSGLLLQNQNNNDNVNKEEDAKTRAKKKQDTQKNNKVINP